MHGAPKVLLWMHMTSMASTGQANEEKGPDLSPAQTLVSFIPWAALHFHKFREDNHSRRNLEGEGASSFVSLLSTILKRKKMFYIQWGNFYTCVNTQLTFDAKASVRTIVIITPMTLKYRLLFNALCYIYVSKGRLLLYPSFMYGTE